MDANVPRPVRTRRTIAPADEILSATSHRPWPLPRRPWAMRQVWSDLLLAHWPASAEAIAARLPVGLTLDTWEGDAWISLVPFQMPYMSIRGLPDVPPFTRLLETNVRTYVRHGNKAGVYFFSLDANNAVTVEAARRWYSLPYFNARFDCDFAPVGVRYSVTRTDRRAAPGEFTGSYRPTGPARVAAPDSLDDWLTARYALYTSNRNGRLLRADITHKPWQLAPAEAEFEVNTLIQSHGIAVADTAPLLQYAEQVDALAWPLAPVR